MSSYYNITPLNDNEYMELNEFKNYVLSLLEIYLHNDNFFSQIVKRSQDRKHVYVPIILNNFPDNMYFPWTEQHIYIRQKRLEYIMNLRNGLETQWEPVEKMDMVNNKWIFREIMIGIANDYLNSQTYDTYKNIIIKRNNMNIVEFKFSKKRLTREQPTFNRFNKNLLHVRQIIHETYTGRHDTLIFNDDMDDMFDEDDDDKPKHSICIGNNYAEISSDDMNNSLRNADDENINKLEHSKCINKTFAQDENNQFDIYEMMLTTKLCHLDLELSNNKSIEV